MPRLFNKRTDGIPYGAVYIGRPSKWGNPHPMHGESDRDRVCDLFEEYLAGRPDLQAAARRELKGKDLVCHCFPKRCHGFTLIRIANEEGEIDENP